MESESFKMLTELDQNTIANMTAALENPAFIRFALALSQNQRINSQVFMVPTRAAIRMPRVSEALEDPPGEAV